MNHSESFAFGRKRHSESSLSSDLPPPKKKKTKINKFRGDNERNAAPLQHAFFTSHQSDNGPQSKKKKWKASDDNIQCLHMPKDRNGSARKIKRKRQKMKSNLEYGHHKAATSGDIINKLIEDDIKKRNKQRKTNGHCDGCHEKSLSPQALTSSLKRKKRKEDCNYDNSGTDQSLHEYCPFQLLTSSLKQKKMKENSNFCQEEYRKKMTNQTEEAEARHPLSGDAYEEEHLRNFNFEQQDRNVEGGNEILCKKGAKKKKKKKKKRKKKQRTKDNGIKDDVSSGEERYTVVYSSSDKHSKRHTKRSKEQNEQFADSDKLMQNSANADVIGGSSGNKLTSTSLAQNIIAKLQANQKQYASIRPPPLSLEACRQKLLLLSQCYNNVNEEEWNSEDILQSFFTYSPLTVALRRVRHLDKQCLLESFAMPHRCSTLDNTLCEILHLSDKRLWRARWYRQMVQDLTSENESLQNRVEDRVTMENNFARYIHAYDLHRGAALAVLFAGKGKVNFLKLKPPSSELKLVANKFRKKTNFDQIIGTDIPKLPNDVVASLGRFMYCELGIDLSRFTPDEEDASSKLPHFEDGARESSTEEASNRHVVQCKTRHCDVKHKKERRQDLEGYKITADVGTQIMALVAKATGVAAEQAAKMEVKVDWQEMSDILGYSRQSLRRYWYYTAAPKLLGVNHQQDYFKLRLVQYLTQCKRLTEVRWPKASLYVFGDKSLWRVAKTQWLQLRHRVPKDIKADHALCVKHIKNTKCPKWLAKVKNSNNSKQLEDKLIFSLWYR